MIVETLNNVAYNFKIELTSFICLEAMKDGVIIKF